MKKNIFLLGLVALLSLPMLSEAQYQPCNTIAHPLFEPASSRKPTVLNRLGTSPQFGEISAHTAKAAYSHLKTVYSRNSKRNKREIDNLLIAMGYSGLNDPRFTEAQITPEILPAGTTGWMGAYAKGHKYNWSVLGKSFETFKITSLDGGCFVYVMRKCGNGFYDPSVRMNIAPTTTPAPFIPKENCLVQTITISGKGAINKSEFVKATESVELVITNGVNPNLCIGNVQLPVSASYDVAANAAVNFQKTVEVCDRGQGVASTSDLKLPIQLAYDVTSQSIKVGNDGRVSMAVSDAQYKIMKKLYTPCAASATTSAAAPSFTKEANNSTTMAASSAAGTSSTTGTNCKVQTLNFAGTSEVKDGKVQTANKEITVVGRYLSNGKMALGEVSDKYLCLGTYQVPANIATAFTVSGGSNVSKTIEICDKMGNKPSVENINVPIDLNYTLSNPALMMGDSGKVYVNLDENQYKTLSKKFGRCCGVEGNANCI